jgi:hypothetical protein
MGDCFKPVTVTSSSGPVAKLTDLDITNKPILLVVPYGMQMNAPTSYQLMGIMGQFYSQGDNQFVFVTDPVNTDKTLNPGEVSFGVPALTNRFVATADGLMQVKNKNATLHNILKKVITVVQNIISSGSFTAPNGPCTYNNPGDLVTISNELTELANLLKD